MEKKNNIVIVLLIIILIGMSLRLITVGSSGSFWFDEIVSLKIAQKSIGESIKYLVWENNPPLHYWFLHYWIKIFGVLEIILRLSSVLFGFLSLIMIYILGQKVFNKKAGLFAAFLVAFSSFQIYTSQDARMYPMLLFFSLVSLYFFWRGLKENKTWLWLFYVVSTLLTYYTHLTGLFLFFIQNLYFCYHYFYLKNKNITFLKWILIQSITLLLFWPFLFVFLLAKSAQFNLQAWYFYTESQGFYFLQIPKSFLFLGEEIPFLDLITIFVFSFLFLFALLKIKIKGVKEYFIKTRFSPEVIFSLLIFFIPLLIGFILNINVTKYFIISSTGLYLLLACGFNNLNLSLKKELIFLLIIFFLFLPYNLPFMMGEFNHQWDKVAKYIEEEEKGNEKIILPAFTYELILKYYYQGSLPIEGFNPKEIKGDTLLRAVKYNWYSLLNEENVEKIKNYVRGYDRIILVSPTLEAVHPTDLVKMWFLKNNWKVIEVKNFKGFERTQVLILERIK